MTVQGCRYAEELKRTMELQIEKLEVFRNREEEIQQEIQESRYYELKQTIAFLQPLSDEIIRIDAERDRIFSLLREESGEEKNAGFYQVAVHLDPELRDELAAVYRKMKIQVIRLQAITCGIEAYIRTVTATVHQILGEIYPHRKGKLYSRGGKATEAGQNPLLINRSL